MSVADGIVIYSTILGELEKQMCGICGFTGPRNDKLLREMNNTLIHRGPDDSGYLADDNINLAHRRLSIIDLTTGHQPMTEATKSIWIIYNGETYNFKALREELKKRNYVFSTSSDTEVILNIYREYGIDGFNKLNGIWAFALYDKNKERLILCRDHVGTKPLYYSVINGELFFASEIKALVKNNLYHPRINYSALDDYIALRYVPGTRTIFENIYKLPPGFVLIHENKNIALMPYWRWDVPDAANTNIDNFEKLLEDSVKMQMVSDVPVGAYLSGGIDSSGIVGLMSRVAGKRVKTFSVGFGEKSDELKWARIVSKHFETDHEEILVKEEDFQRLAQIIYYLDEPLGDAITLALYKLSELAGRKVKVVLTGEGADELVAGYVHQKAMYLGYIYQKFMPLTIKKIIPGLTQMASSNFLNNFFDYPARLGEEGKGRFIKFLKSLENNYLSSAYLKLTSLFDKDDKELLYSNFLKNEIKENNFYEKEVACVLNQEQNILDKLIELEYRFWLPDNILFKQDKMAMANSIEGRVPYLDPLVISATRNFSHTLKKKTLASKYFLKESLKNILPKEILKRKKQAFQLPMGEKFVKIFRELVNEYLDDAKIKKRGYFNYKYIKELKENFYKSPFITSKKLMSLVILEMWHKVFGFD